MSWRKSVHWMIHLPSIFTVDHLEWIKWLEKYSIKTIQSQPYSNIEIQTYYDLSKLIKLCILNKSKLFHISFCFKPKNSPKFNPMIRYNMYNSCTRTNNNIQQILWIIIFREYIFLYFFNINSNRINKNITRLRLFSYRYYTFI